MNTSRRSKYVTISASVGLGLLGSVALVSAGPITNPGGLPFAKLSVYQGVVAIVPGLSGDSVMEIGNAGRDIASTGSIYLRPGSANGQGGNIVIAPQNSDSEGGEILFQGAPSYQSWTADIWQNRFRIHTNGNERLIIDGPTGANIYIPTGSLCFGGVGSTNCSNTWAGVATPTLDQVLAAGNATTRSAALGTTAIPSSKLLVSNGIAGNAGDPNNAISALANTTGSALYAQQNNPDGFAGYFSGRLAVAGQISLNGIDKDEWGIKVCPVGSNSGCLGRYLFTAPNTGQTLANLQYNYLKESTMTITPVNVFTQYTNPTPTCPSGYTLTTRCTNDPSDCKSYFLEATGGCEQFEFEFLEVNDNQPYGSGSVCVNNTPVTVRIGYEQAPPSGTCYQYPVGKYISGRRVEAPNLGTYYLQTYELR